jgi:hypothetical protein
VLTRPRRNVAPLSLAELAGPRRQALELVALAGVALAVGTMLDTSVIRAGAPVVVDVAGRVRFSSHPGTDAVGCRLDGKPKRPGRDSRALQDSLSGPFGEARGTFAVRSQKAPTP